MSPINKYLILLVATLLSFGFWNSYWYDAIVQKYATKQYQIEVKTDIFDTVIDMPAERLLDEKEMAQYLECSPFDAKFKLSILYSEACLAILKKNYNAYYYALFFQKAMNTWDELILQDESISYFKQQYLDEIKSYNVQKQP
jgi:hypothetical protein